MSVTYTTSDLIASIKRRASMPTNQQLFSDTDFLNLATDELEVTLIPLLMSVREEYFVSYVDVQVTGSSPYIIEIPEDAIGMKLRDVALMVNDHPIILPRFSIDDSNQIIFSNYGFKVESNQIHVHAEAETIRLYYFKRPLSLISVSNSAQIKSINEVTNEITVTNVPAIWTTETVLNAVQKAQPFKTMVNEIEIASISSPTIVLASVEGLSLGDWICEQGYSPIPQIPVEAHKVLAQATTVKCLEAINDSNGMASAEKKLERNIKDLITLISPRVDGAPKRIIGTNISSYTSVSTFRGRRRW